MASIIPEAAYPAATPAAISDNFVETERAASVDLLA
jgi:hypothetical protein